MTLELLISTMFQSDHSLLEKMNICSDAVVINQCDRNDREVFFFCGYRVLWINTTERGLSRSRNMALRNATADICMIADDDMVYRKEYPQTVLRAFERLNSNIIGFQVMGIEKEFKHYPAEAHEVSFLQSMKMASVELAFRRFDISKNGIWFDEHIGAGTEFLMGEENAWLFQCLRKKMHIHFVPQIIADLHNGTSTWFTKRDARYFIGKGASFAAMKTPFTIILILQFAIRKWSLYHQETPLLTAIRYMLKGNKFYKQKMRQS